jgi:histidinol-phosphate aminotransferase
MSAASLSDQTVSYLSRASGDYMARDLIELQRMQQLLQEGRLQQILRFDVGSNTDGFSPLARDLFDSGFLAEMLETYLREYPDNQYDLLRRHLANRFAVSPDWFVLGAGLESMIDHITRAFLGPGLSCLIPVPNFCIYEDYSIRQGAQVYLVPMQNPGLWSEEDICRLEAALLAEQPRLLWISNPINPLGCLLPLAVLERLLLLAGHTGTVVVVDEAYAEYTDSDEAPLSAASLLAANPHLIVLRTFSKIYGLPNLRVGYMICANQEYCRGVLAYRPTFPFSWFSLYTCQLALLDDDWLMEARSRLAQRKPIVEQGLDSLPGYERLHSQTNTIMFRQCDLSAETVQHRLADQGVLVANLDQVAGIEGQGWLRMTVRSEVENRIFLDACISINNRREYGTLYT